MVLDSGIACPVLRPTLMFGWFDRKHLGWLSRFMQQVPVFPIPGHGRYMRQPLYVGDFCNVIISCIETRHQRPASTTFRDIEKVDYIDIIRQIKRATGARTRDRPGFRTACSTRCCGSGRCSTRIRRSPTRAA